jgi:hypothetical protein
MPSIAPRKVHDPHVLEAVQHMSLALPRGELNYKYLGVQQYLLKMGGNSILSRDNFKWVIL